MAISTVEDLTTALDASLTWRRTEMRSLQGALEAAEKKSIGSPLARGLARSAVAMIYANWEGYGRDAFTAYVEFISIRSLKLNELNDGLLRTVIIPLANKIRDRDEVALQDLARAIRTSSSPRAAIPKRTMVNTQSNLRFEVLINLLESVGLNGDRFHTRGQFIDRELCDARNRIAHGREDFPKAEECKDLCNEVIAMLETLRYAILGAATAGSYKVT